MEVDNNLRSELDMINLNHYPCFAHTLHLVVKDGKENADKKTGFKKGVKIS